MALERDIDGRMQFSLGFRMTNSSLLVLGVFALATFLASIIGGRFAETRQLTHTGTQVVMSFVAGFILGIAVFHLLPHAIEVISGPNAMRNAVVWIALGIVTTLFLLRVFEFHQHDFTAEASDHGESRFRSVSLIGVVAGLGLHSTTEGIALGASVRAGENEGSILTGLVVCLAIVLHKPLDAYSLNGLMREAGRPRRERFLANFGYALVCPVAALVSFAAADFFMTPEGNVLGYALAFATGAFMCIALSDLLPEIHFHRHDRGKLLASLAVGLSLAFLIYLVEEAAVH